MQRRYMAIAAALFGVLAVAAPMSAEASSVRTAATQSAGNAATGAPARDARPDSSTHKCSDGYLCVHYYDWNTGAYHWADLYACTTKDFPSYTSPTWYMNNQTTGISARFGWSDGSTWWTAPAKHNDYVPLGPGSWKVNPCP